MGHIPEKDGVMRNKVYIAGSLRNPKIPQVGNAIRAAGVDAFDDWYAVGPEADDRWKDYEKGRGRSYADALNGHAAANTFDFDKTHLDQCKAAVMVLPAGRSAHLELGYMAGRKMLTYILLEEEIDRWDVMYLFTDGVFTDIDLLITQLKKDLYL